MILKYLDSQNRRAVALAIIAGGCMGLANHLRAAVVLDLIGDISTFGFTDFSIPLPSQVYPDFPTNDCTVIEDFSVVGSQLWISEVAVLIYAQTGFASFPQVEGYHFNIYSSPDEAANHFQGDVLSAYFPPASATVTKVTDSATGDEYGLVSLVVNLPLPSAGIYWVGVSLQASYSTGGDFRLAAANTTGTTNSAGADNAVLTNPGGGFGIPGNSSQQDHAAAIAVTVVPEPAAPILLLLAAGFGCLRRKRGRG